jgi:ribonuclease R
MEVLGERDAFGVDVEILIRKHHLPHVFPERVLQEARAVAVPPEVRPGSGGLRVASDDSDRPRRDFRDLPIVTIDGETAKDFDDAVMVRALPGGGYELQVHIADVAHYVRPGTALDLEARLRGNSVYFPDRAIPMLPMELSTDVCSLRPDEERLVLSCILQLGPQGEVLSAEICQGVIRSARRMTYNEVHAILDGDAEMRDRYAPLVPEFERMLHVATLLNAQRERRGSIDFDLPEPVVQFDEEGRMRGIVRTERTWANRLIEEFMLAANEAVAGWLEQLGVPSIYRIHEKPDAKRVANFEEIAAHFGYSLGVGALPIRRVELKGDRRERQRRGGGDRRMREIAEDINITPQMYQALTARLAGKPEERILTYLMLRSLKQARYSEKNEGHFALAAPVYTHFTSPIRRYADLIVHRITKAALGAGVSGHFAADGASAASAGRSPQRRQATTPAFPAPIPEAELAAIAQEVSQTERRAADAERELIEWKKIRFMRDHLGDQFSGIVLNVTKYGLFVELDDLFVEGLVPLESLQQDRYRYAENSRQAIGAVSGHRISVGDAVSVILERIDAVENKLQFALVEEPAGGRRGRATAGARPHPSKKQRARQKKEKKRKRS